MKGCIPEAYLLKEKGGKKQCLPVGFNIFKNQRTSEKWCFEIDD